ncbi:universal stress protein [Salinigranum sp. GCM10025319]|uniref:universal stress protein n=1 Tax=Salinigranum sp. GCM10025319 TaxID=3252687 RepID=UPI003619EB46
MVVIAAVDRSDRAPAVVEQAHRHGDAFDEPVQVVHVLTSSEFIELERTSVRETGHAAEMDEVKRVATNIAEEIAERVDGESTPVGLVGNPAQELIAYADQEDAAFVVLSPRRKSPTGKALFGSVAQSVLLNVGCPVVTIVD